MRRILILITIILIFFIIGITALKILDKGLYLNSRIVLLADTQNSEKLKEVFPKISGDYMVAFDGTDKLAGVVYINQKLTLIDTENKSYGSVEYYKENDNENYDTYIKLLGRNFDEPIRDSIIFTEDEPIVNVDDDGKELYKGFGEKLNKYSTIIQNNGDGYDVKDNDSWIKIFENMEYETNEIVNYKLVKDFSSEHKDDENLRREIVTSFITLYIPKLECNDDYCTYDQENIDQITEAINKKMIMKIQYEFEYDKSMTKLDDPIDKETQETIENSYSTKNDEIADIATDPNEVTSDDLESYTTTSNTSPTSSSANSSSAPVASQNSSSSTNSIVEPDSSSSQPVNSSSTATKPLEPSTETDSNTSSESSDVEENVAVPYKE